MSVLPDREREDFGQVLILLPIYKPNKTYLAEQILSLADQTYSNFVCVLSHDGPLDNELYNDFRSMLPDSRFTFLVQAENLGVYRHIERLLDIGLKQFKDAKFISLCDQDDVWRCDRLLGQVKNLQSKSCCMVTDNAVLIDDAGRLLRSRNLFEHLRISKKSLPYALLCNATTGAGSLMRRDIVEHSLPFPANNEKGVHDHWLYLVGLCCGDIFLSEPPSWMYRQHNSNVIGAAGSATTQARIGMAIKKLWSIIRTLGSSNYDAIVAQCIEFEQSLKQRGLELPNSIYQFGVSTSHAQRMALLKPKSLLDSRLESFRFFIYLLKTPRE